ncbi:MULTISPECIES: peptidyl-prolyl cis-trans isomerase [Clostridia]|uniref:peptidylprolyl isomerase n=1 Tax=Clostridia TaxID=186801 RepID=UPI000E491760|nr:MULTISPECIES: peptidylprolyl isomerase [Clostridia]RHV08714.1 peptidyl-prolyl cis-trans isomerase [Firmicutes bacterium OM07-11]RKQ31207.1 peptidyl-prolyl cis-trans isomerase [Ruminococcus sp. B05]TAP34750.1 peptidyl-prolyl cis-trans isomerase [Mediterraneibacter sp. gm002]
MNQWKKRVTALGLAGMLAVTGLTGCGSMNNDDVVATVGESEIKLGVANFYARMQQAQYETYYAGMMGTTGEELWAKETDGKTYEQSVKSNMIKSLENMYILEQHASEYDVALSEDEKKAIDKAAEEFDENNALEDKEAVSGYNKYVKKVLELLTIQSKMEDVMTADVDTEVSDDEAAQKSMKYVFYSYTKDENDSTSTMSEIEKTEAKQKATDFAEKLKNSDTKDIDAVANEAGMEVQTATFDSESTSPNADLVKAADALTAEGDVTDAIETDSGIYVAKVTSFLDRTATDAKKQSIVEERKQDQYDAFLKKWRKKTNIDLNKRVWKKVDFQKQGVTVKDTSSNAEESAE